MAALPGSRRWEGRGDGAANDDYAAETGRLEAILGLLTEEQWLTESGASGWSVADVVLHLAQSEEGVVASAGGSSPREAAAAAGTVDDWAARMVEAERAAAAQVYTRWRRALEAAVAALRAADPQVPLQLVTGPVKPATLATTRLAEHWAHGLDITRPLGIDFPYTSLVMAYRVASAPRCCRMPSRWPARSRPRCAAR